MFKNSIHQSQEGLRRLKEIPKLHSLSCDENVLRCARRLTCNAELSLFCKACFIIGKVQHLLTELENKLRQRNI